MLWVIFLSSLLSTIPIPIYGDSSQLPNYEIEQNPNSINPLELVYEQPVIYSYDTIDKLHVQEHITRRDIERSKNATWKTYFAEILAGLILLAGIIIFICWWSCTNRGEQPHREGSHGWAGGKFTLFMNQRQQLIHRRSSSPASRRGSLIDIPIGSTPMKPMKCPKACVCGPEGQVKGQRKWNYKEDNEPYGPVVPASV